MSQLEFEFMMSALADYDEDGHAQIQTDSPGLDGKEGTLPAEILTPLGLYALPLDPDKADGVIGLGSSVLCVTAGDHRYTMPWNDPRDVPLLPKLRKGGRMFAGGAGKYRSFVIIDGLDKTGEQQSGSITVAVPYAKGSDKKSLGLSFNVRKSGAEEIAIVHGEGQRLTMSAKGSKSIVLSAADGKTWYDISNDGHVIAGKCAVQGSLVVGQPLAAMPVAIAPIVAAMFDLVVGCMQALAGATSNPASIIAGASVPAVAPLLPGIVALKAKLNAMHLKAT